MKKEQKIISIILALGFLALGLTAFFRASNTSYSAVAITPAYTTATNASSSCGRYATASITVGSTSTATSTTTGIITIVYNGTTVTSTSENTSTVATTIAGDIRTALNAASTTLSINVSTSSNVVNVTSTLWGAFSIVTGANPQNGLSITIASSAPSTQIVAGTGSRVDFEASNDSTNTIYLCKNTTCHLNTGIRLATGTGQTSYKQTDLYGGAYSCMPSTTSSVLNYVSSQ